MAAQNIPLMPQYRGPHVPQVSGVRRNGRSLTHNEFVLIRIDFSSLQISPWGLNLHISALENSEPPPSQPPLGTVARASLGLHSGLAGSRGALHNETWWSAAHDHSIRRDV